MTAKQTHEPKYVGIFIGNGYISPLQHGLQAAHVVTRMFIKYDRDFEEKQMIFEWGDSPTKWLLDGGYQERLEEVYAILQILSDKIYLPYAKFHEEVPALNGALTSVGFVVDTNKFPKTNGFRKNMNTMKMFESIRNKKLSEAHCYAVLKWLAYNFKRA